MRYSNSLERASQAVLDRVQSLKEQEDAIKKMADNQFGVTIPRAFTDTKSNFIVDPSNVGTGILDRMIKTDDTISAAVQFKILMILSKIGEYHHDDQEIKDFVKKFISDMRKPTWSQSLQSMLSYHGYKFSVSEIIFGMDSELRKVPRKVITYHPSTIAFEVDENGEITDDGVIQFTNQHSKYTNPNWAFSAIRHGFKVNNPFTTPIDRLHPHRIPWFTQIGMVRIPRNKVIHHVGQSFNSFGNPYGSSAVRTVHLLWQLKVFILKQMGIASKKGATNKIWATAPHGAQKVEIVKGDGTKETVSPAEAVRQMLSDVETQDSFVTGPEDAGYKLSTLGDGADLNQFVAVINALNIWIFRGFLLPSLVLTDGQAGSRSLGDKHFQLVDKVSDSEAEDFTEIVINEMIERTIIENFGEQEDYGKFNKRPQTIAERQSLASMFGGLANDGWMKPHVEEDARFVRENLNLPEDTDKTFELTGESENDFDDDGLEPGTQIPGADSGFDSGKIDSIIKVVEKIEAGSISADAGKRILIGSGMSEEEAKGVIGVL